MDGLGAVDLAELAKEIVLVELRQAFREEVVKFGWVHVQGLMRLSS